MPFGMMGIAKSMLLLCLLCLISLINANTSPTIHTQVSRLCEDIPINGTAFTIEATDAENDPLTFSLIEPNTEYFQVDNETGRVTVRKQLDRESDDLLDLGVSVSDGVNPATTKLLRLIILDANDRRPIFVQFPNDIAIKENTPVGTTLFKVQATDEDTGYAGTVHYSIDRVTPNSGVDLFSIGNTGEVKLKGSLNYTSLSTFYQLKINATDGGGKCYENETVYLSSSIFSFIEVLDVPDLDPQFIGVPYIVDVQEHSPLDKSVLKVTAIDRDLGVNDDIVYSIEDSSADDLFKISREDGVISVSSDIDREVTNDIVTLTVKATESQQDVYGNYASTTAHVQINILDINDNWPEFYKCGGSVEELSCVKANHFTGEVFEGSSGTISINMTVKDPDKNSRTQLILQGTDSDVFSVEPQIATSSSVIQLLVRKPQLLDYETKQEMVIEMIAIDADNPSFNSNAMVTISIRDTNDNSPKFPKDTYELDVAEHSPVGTVIAEITAEDPDTMDQGNLTYTLLPESILMYFDVDPQTGAVYVKNETLLDREARSLFLVTLQARDTEGKPGTAVLEITLTDINDQRPVINRDSYLDFVEEGGELELKIEATDADMPNTVNSQIVYGIEPSAYSDNFTIDPNTGVLSNRGEIDLEAMDPKLNGKIELSVTATDMGSPPLSSIVTVIITVEDVNDNIPQFYASSYNFSVKEGEKGGHVGSVYAVDLDQTTEFNRVSFTIIDGGFGSFIIRSVADASGYRGDITVDPDIELDYESERKQFVLRVEAADLEERKTEVMVEVSVLDVNDERPEFIPIEPVTVKENTTYTGAIGNFTGHDKDGNHSLIYILESIECICHGSTKVCSSFILDPTGEVSVNPEETLDYEKCDMALIEAYVVDEFTEKGENISARTGLMEINIEDINDNAPQFIPSDSVSVVVSESASRGSSVARVSATDRDTGLNGQIEFRVTTVQLIDANNETSTMGSLFEATTTEQEVIFVGSIQTTTALDMNLKGKYLVTVIAADAGGNSVSTVLEIFIVDRTYRVELEFTLSEEEAKNNELEITRALTAATKATVVLIYPETSPASRAAGNTVIIAYFVYDNGTALTSSKVEVMLSDPEHYPTLGQLGLTTIGSAELPAPETDPVMYILLGIVGGLVIVLAVLTTSLMCTRRTYRRKLKAAKAMNSATMVTSDNQKSGPIVPGTNKYTMEGANPVLNLNINTAGMLNIGEESSDVDKVSLNSLDSDSAIYEKDITYTMELIQEEDDEMPEYVEPLDVALAQRGQKKASGLDLGFNNPAFSTTDL